MTTNFKMSVERRARLAAMTPEEIERNAQNDPDNPPMTDDELARIVSSRAVRQAREATGLSRIEFAECFDISATSLRDWEQGRYRPESAVLAYMRVIQRSPSVVAKALGKPLPKHRSIAS